MTTEKEKKEVDQTNTGAVLGQPAPQHAQQPTNPGWPANMPLPRVEEGPGVPTEFIDLNTGQVTGYGVPGVNHPLWRVHSEGKSEAGASDSEVSEERLAELLRLVGAREQEDPRAPTEFIDLNTGRVIGYGVPGMDRPLYTPAPSGEKRSK